MVIEFHNPHKKVNEWLIDYVRDAVIELHNEHREISRAEIYFRERKEKKIQWQICEIHLSIYGNSLTITGSDKNFDGASRKAVQELRDIVEVNFRRSSEPPGEITSTVDV